jgi:heme-degrading monooxygenase HmoA
MFVTVNHIPAPGDAGPALEARFRQRQRLVDGLPGFRSFELLRPRGDGEYLVMTSWATRADFDAWRTTPQQRQVRPAQAGHLSHADMASWPSFHESTAERYGEAWPPSGEVSMTIEPIAEPPRQLALDEGCLSAQVLRTVDGSWSGDDENGPASRAADGSEYLLVRRWAGQPSDSAASYDILQPSYAALTSTR